MATHTYLEHGLTILQTRLQGQAGQPPAQAIADPPFLTISREVCSGATTLGHALLPILDKEFGREGQSWMFLDKNLLIYALTSHQLPERLAEFLPEDRISEIKAVIGELVGLHPPLWELEHQVEETIRQLARAGRVILTGRGAPHISRKMPGGFHVRLVAGRETRIARMMSMRGCSHQVAADHVDDADRARRRFVRTNFGADIDDPHIYDLVINTDRLPPEAVARMVIEGLRSHRA